MSTPSTALAPRGQFDLSPQTFDQALTFANYLAESEMVPKQYRNRAGDCLIAMQWGMEIGLKPLQALQSIAAVNGKPSIYGDAGKAMLLAAGCEIDEDDTAIIRSTGVARCKITRPGRRPVERTFSIEDAKTAQLWGKAGPWTTSPYRQMAWRAFWFAARDAAADLLRGMGGAEEAADYTQAAAKDMGDVERADPAGNKEPAAFPVERFTKNLPEWRKAIALGKATADGVIAKARTIGALTDEQEKAIRAPITDAEKATAKPATQDVTDVQPKSEQAEASEQKFTFAQVAEYLNSATDLKALEVAADLIGAVDAPQHRTELTEIFEERKTAFEPK